MRYLPCQICHRPALATREGILHCAGQLSVSPLQYVCKRCGNLMSITISEFMRLPEMTKEEIAAPTCDIDLPPVP